MTAVTDQDHTEQAGNAVPGESGDGERPVEEPLPEAEAEVEVDAEVEPEGEDEHARVETVSGPESGPERDEEGNVSQDPGRAPADGHARVGAARARRDAGSGSPEPVDAAAPADDDSADAWDDGLIARRVTAETEQAAVMEARGHNAPPAAPLTYDGPLHSRLDALRELVGLSRARLDSRTLAEAGQVLDEAAARRRLSGQHTVVAIAGATGSGKSQLFNSLAGVAISETGVRRPPRRRRSRAVGATVRPVSSNGSASRPGCGGARCRVPSRRPNCAGSSWSTCPTTTRPRSSTASTWTGSWRSSTPSSGSSTPRSTPTRSCTSAICDPWRATRR